MRVYKTVIDDVTVILNDVGFRVCYPEVYIQYDNEPMQVKLRDGSMTEWNRIQIDIPLDEYTKMSSRAFNSWLDGTEINVSSDRFFEVLSEHHVSPEFIKWFINDRKFLTTL